MHGVYIVSLNFGPTLIRDDHGLSQAESLYMLQMIHHVSLWTTDRHEIDLKYRLLLYQYTRNDSSSVLEVLMELNPFPVISLFSCQKGD